MADRVTVWKASFCGLTIFRLRREESYTTLPPPIGGLAQGLAPSGLLSPRPSEPDWRKLAKEMPDGAQILEREK